MKNLTSLKQNTNILSAEIKSRQSLTGILTVCLILVLYVGWGQRLLVKLSQKGFFNVVLAPENTWLFAILFCVSIGVVIYLLWSCYIKRNCEFGNFVLSASLFAILIWIDCRFIAGRWNFVCLPDTPIAYFDILVVIPISILCLYFYSVTTSNKHSSAEGRVGSERLDMPIQAISEDKLNREPFVKLLSERFTSFDVSTESVSIAIIAPWGNGKTSFLNMLIENIEKSYPQTYKVIRFSPWRYTKTVNKTKLFFEILIHQTNELNISLSKLLKRYSSLLTEFDIPLKNKLSELFETDNDMNSLFQKVNDELKKSKYKYLIVIDDIDRLEGEEILEIIKIIRESANFSNLIFVVAFDKDYVNEALKNLSPAINERYIEKFFPV